MAATVLLVDDSLTILMAIGCLLKNAGLAVVTATSGEEALLKMQKGARPDLMITDLNMGAMDGIDLIRNTRKLPGMRFTPILMLSAESRQAYRNEAKSAGADGWIVKPVDVGALKQVVHKLISCSTCPQGSVNGSCGSHTQVDFAIGTSAKCATSAEQTSISKAA